MLFTCTVCGVQPETRKRGQSRYYGAKCRRTFELQEHHRKRAARGLPRVGDKIPCQGCGVKTLRATRSTKYCERCSAIKQSERTVRYRQHHRNLMNKRNRDREKHPRHNLNRRMKSAVHHALKGQKAGRRWESLVGYKLADLIAHIERQFLPQMTWQNMGRWHIDHIVPKASFNFHSAEDEAFQACWALTNLRPLWGQENVKKSATRTHLL